MATAEEDPVAAVAQNYRAFARLEARGRSPAYEALAHAAADDPVVMDFVASLPPDKRQPNLLFAAARYLLGVPADIARLGELVSGRRPELTEVMATRRTQTNEPARCAFLLPALAQLREPLALIEVGASAGLTLLFDRYSYNYSGYRLIGSDPAAPMLRCRPRGPVPLPWRMPVIAWRAGLDLNPLDVTDADDVRWLSALVWPGEADRAERLAAAIESARRDPPVVHRGDLVTDVPALAAEAPAGATLVIYHSSVLYQVTPARRAQFIDTVRGLRAVWLSNEAPGVLPGPAARPDDDQMCVLARDGRVIAHTDSHGAWVRWLS
jgi:hypothetical protein